LNTSPSLNITIRTSFAEEREVYVFKQDLLEASEEVPGEREAREYLVHADVG